MLPKQKVHVAAAVYFAGLLLFGAPAAVALAALGQLLGGATLAARRYRDRRTRLRSLRGVLFNAGQACLAVGLAGLVYYSLVPHRAPAPLEEAASLCGPAGGRGGAVPGQHPHGGGDGGAAQPAEPRRRLAATGAGRTRCSPRRSSPSAW